MYNADFTANLYVFLKFNFIYGIVLTVVLSGIKLQTYNPLLLLF